MRAAVDIVSGANAELVRLSGVQGESVEHSQATCGGSAAYRILVALK